MAEPIYSSEYFSGSQAAIYIGDIYIDEAVSIAYTYNQHKTPIYGYASQLFDIVAPGPVLVQGALTTNYTEAGYLWLVLKRYKQLESLSERFVGAAGLSGGSIRSGSKTILDVARVTPESLENIEKVIKGEASEQQKYSLMRSLAEFGELSGKQFQQMVDEFENRIWGTADGNLDTLDQEARRVDDNTFDDVEIIVAHGDLSNPMSPSTVRRIRNVHFTSASQENNPTGDPILETYQFLARNVI